MKRLLIALVATSTSLAYSQVEFCLPGQNICTQVYESRETFNQELVFYKHGVTRSFQVRQPTDLDYFLHNLLISKRQFNFPETENSNMDYASSNKVQRNYWSPNNSQLCYERLEGRTLKNLSGLIYTSDCILLSSESRNRLRNISLPDIRSVLKSIKVHQDLLDLRLTKINQLKLSLEDKPECVNKSWQRGSWIEAAVSYVGTAGSSVNLPSTHYVSNCSLKAAIFVRGENANGELVEKSIDTAAVVLVETEFGNRNMQKKFSKIMNVLIDNELSERTLERHFRAKILSF